MFVNNEKIKRINFLLNINYVDFTFHKQIYRDWACPGIVERRKNYIYLVKSGNHWATTG